MNNKEVECSVVVCTYHPNWEKLWLTIKSILVQEDCDFEIIITDDGSSDNYFYKIQDCFSRWKFDNYELVASFENVGTVRNALRGIRASKGEFVKLISPGDYLYGKKTLRQWIDFMHKHKDCVMSYGDAVYYHWRNEELIPVRVRSNPQSIKQDVKSFLLYGDICLGAATLVRRKEWIKYLEIMSGRVIYAEDFSYKMMLYCGEKIIYFPQCCLLYEYGTGISTCNSQSWRNRLVADDAAGRAILLTLEAGEEARKLKVNDFLRLSVNSGWRCRYEKYKRCPSIFLYHIKRKFFPRKTSVDLDIDFVNELLKK